MFERVYEHLYEKEGWRAFSCVHMGTLTPTVSEHAPSIVLLLEHHKLNTCTINH